MRTKKLLPFVVIALVSCSLAQAGPFGNWAARGVVVNKSFRSTPLSHSLGLDGIYRLELKGADKKVRRQMVTREIFLAYQIGDEFDEHATPAASKKAQVAAVAAEKEKTPKVESLADVMDGKLQAATKTESLLDVLQSKNRLASANFPREMLPETEGF
ncbi:MAG: hypothetical protein ABI674_00030 [Spartobacteria bacterium]